MGPKRAGVSDLWTRLTGMADAEVFFVTIGTAAARHESSFKRTFQSCQDADLEPRLLDALSAAASATADGGSGPALARPKDNAVYVFDAFEGKAFESLQARRCRVYGPPCVQQCLDRGESLPKVGHPVYCFSMRGAVVCCTSVPPEQRSHLHRLVQYMGGEVSGSFTEVVTHLVALGVGSPKYEVAAARKLPVLTPDWILSAWQRCCGSGSNSDDDGCSNEPASALQPAFADRFACPVFKGLTITTSALPNRKAVRELIEQNGGVFSGEMRVGDCTHLVVNEPTGAKYEHAKMWNVAIVRPQWLHDCVQAGYRLAERPYGFEGKRQASTPIGAASAAGARLPVILDVSAIGNASTGPANMTVQSCDGGSRAVAGVSGVAMSRDPLDEVKVIRAGLFLDGCRVYAHGFSATRLAKVRKLIDSSGAVRVGAIAQKPSHILMADDDGVINALDGLAATLRTIAPAPHLVSVAWLVQCIKQEKLLDAAPFAVSLPTLGATFLSSSSASTSSRCATTPIKPPAPSRDKQARKPLTVSNEANSSVSAAASRRSMTSAAAGSSTLEKDLDIVSQYSSGWSADESALAAKAAPSEPSTGTVAAATVTWSALDSPAVASAEPETASVPVATIAGPSAGAAAREPPAAGRAADASIGGGTSAVAATDQSAGGNSSLLEAAQPVVQPDAQGADAGEPCLHGVSIAFRGFAEDDLALLKTLVTENGGTFAGGEVTGAAAAVGYVVLPLEGCSGALAVPSAQRCTVATVTWLQSCLETGRLLPVGDSPLFSPIDMAVGCSPLDGCVISVSGFVGSVREAVYHVVQLAGGQAQENLAKKATSAVKATTHLILSEPSGRKYSAAKAWGIPTLPLAWLLDTARLGCRQSEAEYSLVASPVAAAAAVETSASAAPPRQERKSAAADVSLCTSAPSKAARDAAAKDSVTTGVGHVANGRAEGLSRTGARLARVHACEPASGLAWSHSEAAERTPAQGKDGSGTELAEPAGCVRPLGTTACADAVARAAAPTSALARRSGNTAGPASMPPPSATPAAAASVGVRRRLETPQLGGRASDMTPMTKSRKLGIDTPSKWLDPDTSFHPGFDLGSCAVEARTPPATHGAAEGGRRSSLPMEELLSRHLRMALEGEQHEPVSLPAQQCLEPRAAPPVPAADKSTLGAQERGSLQQQQQEAAAAPGAGGLRRLPLAGVVAFLGRSLPDAEQAELGAIVVELGGTWHSHGTPDAACTHHVSSTGARADERRQLPAADGVHFVSPLWLRACRGAQARVDEKAYPSSSGNSGQVSSVAATAVTSPSRSNSTWPAAAAAAVRRSARLHADAAGGTGAGAGRGDGHASRQQQVAGDSSQGAARAALCDQLQSFISTTKKPAKSDRRRSRRRALSAADDDGCRLSAGCNRENLGGGGSSSSGGSRVSAADLASGDPSQRVQVMWDDAISREEARKLAEHLDRASCPMDDGQSAVATIKKLLHEQRQLQQHEVDAAAATRSSAGADDDSGVAGAAGAVQAGHCPAFLLSGLSAEERDSYGTVVHGLGGTLLDSPSFDERCTHLIVSKPTRNEKFLACVATGKWILHPSYFDACSQASCFVDEARYEWGGPGLAAICQQLGESTAKLAAAARRRRLAATACTEQDAAGGCGWRAFANWRTVLCTEEAKEGGFRRLLEAGGATVVATRPPFDRLRAGDVSHAFIDLRKTAYSAVDFDPLLKLSVPCLRPDYLASYLTEETLPSIRDFQVTELRSAAADVSTSSIGGKRRLLATANSSMPMKRSR